MKIEINFTNTTDFVAWWGAIISTLVFLWDIYKWKTTGPKLSVSTSSNMKALNLPGKENKTWITLHVQNNGDKPTTIMNVGIKVYKNKFFKFIRKRSKAFVVPGVGASPNQSIPYVLNVGCIWQGLILQTEELEKFAKENIIICEVYCSHRAIPVESRIEIDEVVPQNKSLEK